MRNHWCSSLGAHLKVSINSFSNYMELKSEVRGKQLSINASPQGAQASIFMCGHMNQINSFKTMQIYFIFQF